MKKFILTTLVILSSTSSFAVEYLSPRTMGLGGAGRGAPMLNDAIYLNPSYASFSPVYSMAGGYTWWNGRNYNFSVQDARTELFQAGVGFTKRDQNGAVNIGASKAVLKQLGVGIGSKILFDDNTSKMTTDFMLSSSFIATDWVYASIVLDNLIQGNEQKARNLYRSVYAGFKFIVVKEIQAYFDPYFSPDYVGGNKGGYSLGAEFALLADFYLRMGQFKSAEVPYLNTRGDGFGLGVGWVGPRLTIDYSMHRVTSAHNGQNMTTAQGLLMTIFI